jgi:hypothetical protein
LGGGGGSLVWGHKTLTIVFNGSDELFVVLSVCLDMKEPGLDIDSLKDFIFIFMLSVCSKP